MDVGLMGLRASAIEMQYRAHVQKIECEIQLYALKAKMAQFTGIHDVRMGKPAPSKCPSCGNSHEFRQHHGRTICAYCRCGQ